MIEVIKPGLLTTVQDQGRWGYQCYGVAVAGAMDLFALAAANRLVGNPEGAAGLEMTVLGPALRFHREATFALAGADLGPRLNGELISNWTGHFAQTGALLDFAGRKSGIRAYLAICRGIDVPPVMGSRATYLLGRFGGLKGRALKHRDHLPITPPAPGLRDFVGRVFPEDLRPRYTKNPTLRVVPGPFADFFSGEATAVFFSTEYTINPQSDRMGYRLRGEPLRREKSKELISCGLANGTIQVPPDGQPIILLADRQSIGGYPIIATLILADLPLIAQCVPGDRVRFSPVSLDEAREEYLKLWGKLRNFS